MDDSRVAKCTTVLNRPRRVSCQCETYPAAFLSVGAQVLHSLRSSYSLACASHCYTCGHGAGIRSILRSYRFSASLQGTPEVLFRKLRDPRMSSRNGKLTLLRCSHFMNFANCTLESEGNVSFSTNSAKRRGRAAAQSAKQPGSRRPLG